MLTFADWTVPHIDIDADAIIVHCRMRFAPLADGVTPDPVIVSAWLPRAPDRSLRQLQLEGLRSLRPVLAAGIDEIDRLIKSFPPFLAPAEPKPAAGPPASG